MALLGSLPKKRFCTFFIENSKFKKTLDYAMETLPKSTNTTSPNKTSNEMCFCMHRTVWSRKDNVCCTWDHTAYSHVCVFAVSRPSFTHAQPSQGCRVFRYLYSRAVCASFTYPLVNPALMQIEKQSLRQKNVQLRWLGSIVVDRLLTLAIVSTSKSTF